MNREQRAFRALLRPYPRDFRARYAKAMADFHHDRLTTARARGRSLLRRPLFSTTVVSTIALGVGVTSAIFSVVSGLLVRPLPYPHADRLIAFRHEPPHWLACGPDFVDYRDGLRTLAGLAAYTMSDVTLSTPEDPERLRSARVSEEFFGVLGVQPLVVRT